MVLVLVLECIVRRILLICKEVVYRLTLFHGMILLNGIIPVRSSISSDGSCMLALRSSMGSQLGSSILELKDPRLNCLLGAVVALLWLL